MLARGELHTIGATTLDEYRKHIEKDAALERRFQPVFVDQPTVEETISILRGLRERYEVHHGVRITDSALVAAAALSDRYITDRFLPDKAIDLVDEAASRLRMEMDSMPVELDELERRRIQLEIEREALRKEKDDASKARLEALERELADLAERAGALKSHWEQEKAAIGAIRATKTELEQLQLRDRGGRARGRLRRGRRAQLRPPARSSRAADRAGGGRSPRSRVRGALLKEEVDADDIAEHRRRPGPASRSRRLMEGEQAKLIHMEERLHERVVGQDEAIAGRVRRGPPRPRRAQGPAPAHRLVHLPGPHRRGQDRARPGAGRVPLRRRARHDAHRHERVHGEVRGVAASSARRPATSATRRAASSPRRSAGGRTRSSCSTRSRRPTRTSSTSCSRSSTTAA